MPQEQEPLSEEEIINRLKAAQRLLLIIIREGGPEEGVSHLQHAVDALELALLKLQLSR